MAKITLTRDNRYVETPFTINVTGTNLKGKYIQIFYAEKRYDEGTWTVDLLEKKLTNNTTFSTKITPTQQQLDDVYNFAFDTTELRIDVLIWDGLYQNLVTNYSFLTYIEPVKPTFTATPTYEVMDNYTRSFCNDTTTIINGLSTIKITNTAGQAYKDSYVEFLNVNGINYNNRTLQLGITIDPIVLTSDKIEVSLVDRRGIKSDPVVIADINNIKDYHIPIIKEMVVERDGISTTTQLTVKGTYTEGYELGVEPLTPNYEFQEITNDGSGIIEFGTTQLTVTRTPTTEWQDYQAILEEYNNPHYIETEFSEYVEDELITYIVSYYTKTTFESDIQSLFETALKYNNKYTQEYLENDYVSSSQRYYCLSGGYSDNGSWHTFWEDTLKAIKQTMYGTYIYGKDDKDYGNGGNYEFEIQTTFITGDISTGFTLDKTFNIWMYINKNPIIYFNKYYYKTAVAMQILSTAIPAIDVYKDKVALHGLYDDTLYDSDIQLWGNVYLNGSKINAGVLQMVQTANLDTLSTNYNYFPLFYSNSEIDIPVSTTDKLVLGHKTINYGDRTNSTVYGVIIGSGVELIRVNFSARYLNNHTANQAISTSIFVYKNNSSSVVYGCSTTAGANNRLTETGSYYLEVEEGDFIFLVGWRGVKNSDVDVIASNNATNMSIEIIN